MRNERRVDVIPWLVMASFSGWRREGLMVREMDEMALLRLFRQAGKLKRIRRTGWVQRGVAEPESVADHSHRTAFMALLLAGRFDVDPLRLIGMAIIHDLAEAVVGDITPGCGVSREEKHARERAAMGGLLAGLPDGERLMSLWSEYEEGVTSEARLAKDIDKLEMALQAVEYQERSPGKDLSEFFRSAREGIGGDEMTSLLEKLLSGVEE